MQKSVFMTFLQYTSISTHLQTQPHSNFQWYMRGFLKMTIPSPALTAIFRLCTILLVNQLVSNSDTKQAQGMLERRRAGNWSHLSSPQPGFCSTSGTSWLKLQASLLAGRATFNVHPLLLQQRLTSQRRRQQLPAVAKHCLQLCLPPPGATPTELRGIDENKEEPADSPARCWRSAATWIGRPTQRAARICPPRCSWPWAPPRFHPCRKRECESASWKTLTNSYSQFTRDATTLNFHLKASLFQFSCELDLKTFSCSTSPSFQTYHAPTCPPMPP